MAEALPRILLDGGSSGEFGASWRFSGYLETVQAFAYDELLPALAKVDKAAAAGFHAVGFIAYEAAAGLNPDLPAAQPLEGLPLLWFAIYRERHRAAAELPETDCPDPPRLQPGSSPANYLKHVERIKEYIACGDTYQVNYTFTMKGAFSGDPLSLYQGIARRQNSSFNAFIDTGRFCIISASPELFFSLQDGLVRTRPMKGTAGRGRWLEEDRLQIAALRASPKERAENLMIVDLLRNDLGMIAETGSVKVESLFAVETYPTLHQMTSSVAATVRNGAGLAGIFSALFPCGSVTGAPKRRSMAIIGELEGAPRGVYCGAIGCVAPGGAALFSVAIRTLLFDREQQTLSLGIGSGITADSQAEEEYRECLAKAAFFCQPGAEFCLIESLRLQNGSYPLLQRHLARLRSSAAFFGFSLDEVRVMAELERHAAERTGVAKVRLLLAKNGECTLSSAPLTAAGEPLRLAISSIPVDSRDIFRYHKTTRRELLDAGRAGQAGVDEVLFLNERGELTEGSYHNLLVKINGRTLTPRRESGLLGGVMRQELLDRGEIVEATLFPADLLRADEVSLINAVRGVRQAVIVEGELT